MIIRLLLLSFIATMGAGAAAEQQPPPMPIVTGNTIVHDLAQRIGGEHVTVTCLLQPGVDPHTYQPVPDDARHIAGARLVIINGLGFEGWFEGLAKDANFSGTVVIATAGIDPLKMHDADHGGSNDPHAYHSLVNGVRYAENIRDALMVAEPMHADAFRSNAAKVISELQATDAWAKQILARINKRQRIIITNHDALQYFANEYGFEILAPNTALEDSQPSAKDIASLVELIRDKDVRGIFVEFGKNQKVIEQVASEAGVKVGAALYLDGVGPRDSTAATYVGMFRTNVHTIVAGLTE